MPVLDTRPRSLAAVIDAIAARDDLSSQAKSELTSAIRTFCRCVGRDPSEIDANPVALRALVHYAKPELAGVGAGHFKNTLSRLKRALTEVRIDVDHRRNMPPDPAWDVLLATLTRRARVELRKFAGWCSARSIAPAAVTQQTFANYFAFLVEQSIQHNVKERWRRAWRVWNAEVAGAGSGYPHIDSLFDDKDRLISLEELPPQFGIDLKVYQDAMTRPTLFGGATNSTTAGGLQPGWLTKGRRKALRPATARGYAANLDLFVGYLVRDGVPPEYFSSLDKLVDPDLMLRGLERIQRDILAEREKRRLWSTDPMTAPPAGDPEEPVPLVTAVAYAVLSLAKYVGADPDVLKKIADIATNTRVPRKGMTVKNKARLNQFADERALKLLLGLPARVFARHAGVEKATFKQAREVQNAAILAVLIELPMRVGNVAGLDLAHHFQRPVGSAGGKWLVSITAHEVKNKETIDGEFTEATSALLDRYVAVFRPAIADKISTALFPGRSGKAKRSTTISSQFAAFIRRETGLLMNAHLMRAFASGICLNANPGDFETPRLLLAHKSIDTTRRFYAHIDQRRSHGRYHDIVDTIRNGPSEQGKTGFHFGRRRRSSK